MSQADLKQLLLIIEQQLDWGEPAAWQSKDFEILNDLILEKTKVSLSASTLRRLWGRVEYNHMPSGTTLDTLARFAGFESWRVFLRQRNGSKAAFPVRSKKTVIPVRKRALWTIIVLAAIGLTTFTLVAMHVSKIKEPGSYSFSIRPVTHSIPNSVVFNYDVHISPSDSVYFQQSWDPDTRVTLDRNRHEYTSVYYRPGFYHAKLLVNNKIVKEKLFTVPTSGWLGLIGLHPIPVYLSPNEFMHDGMLQIPASVITARNIQMGPQPPVVEYYNVGNFIPVSLKNFAFSAELRNDYGEGAATCRYTQIILFTDNVPVIIPISAKGCISDLQLLNGRYFESGKTHDLSGFGTDLSHWVKVSCRAAGDKIEYLINDKPVFESPLPPYQEKIVGIGFRFQGTGSVKNIRLVNSDQIVFLACDR